jgi:hypothetical protein
MAERAEHDPTMEEIVVALRETKRGAGRMPPLTVVGGHPGVNWTSGMAADAANGTAGSIDITELRDGEIERLLAENGRLNERVVFLLKVIEHKQAQSAAIAADHAAIERDRDVLFRDLRAAVEAELRPVLVVMLRLLEKQRAGHEAADPATPQAPRDADWIVDLDAQRS